MKLIEYLDCINQGIELRYYPNQNNRWCAHFENCDIMEENMLRGAHGNSDSPEKAIEDYLSMVRGKRIVFHAHNKEFRREYVVPANLEY